MGKGYQRSLGDELGGAELAVGEEGYGSLDGGVCPQQRSQKEENRPSHG